MIIGKKLFQKHNIDIGEDIELLEFLDTISLSDIEDNKNIRELLFKCNPFFSVEEDEYFKHKAAIVNSSNIYNSYHLSNSELVWDSLYIMNSRMIKYGEHITDSQYIFTSTDIENSRDIISSSKVKNSSHIFKSSEIDGCINVYSSNNCHHCYFCQYLTNCEYCLFCDTCEGARFMIFNKEVAPRVFFIISAMVQQIISEECRDFIVPYECKNNKRDMIFYCVVFPQMAYLKYSQKFYDFIKTSPNYDANIMYNLTWSTQALKI